jgi:glycosyltransferase involved in cell wall biosynthesis
VTERNPSPAAAAAPRPVRVAALTGGLDNPATRFRILQMAPALGRCGIALSLHTARLSCYPPRARWLRPLWLPATLAARLPDIAATRGADVTLIQREFVSTLYTLEGLTARPRVLDVDDAIWLNRGDGAFARRLARAVDLVVAGNDHVAAWFGRHGPPTVVVPTAVDTARFVPAAPPAAPPADGPARPPAVGWTGSSANFPYLLLWEDALLAALAAVPDLRVRICADRPPPLARVPADRLDWVRWSPAAEVPFLQSLDVGLMPLEDSDWARGKCAYKMLLYMACGVPVVVSPVGMNQEVLAQAAVGDGARDARAAAQAIIGQLEDPARRLATGLSGRRVVQESYSIDVLAPRLAGALRRAAGRD